jgi:hypothetical protein
MNTQTSQTVETTGNISQKLEKALARIERMTATMQGLIEPEVSPNPGQIQKAAYSISEAVKVSGFGRSKLFQAIHNGELQARKNGKKLIILHSDLMDFLENLPVASPKLGDRLTTADQKSY